MNNVFDENTLNVLGYPTPGNALMYSIIVLYAEVLGISISILLAIISLIDFSLEALKHSTYILNKKTNWIKSKSRIVFGYIFYFSYAYHIIYIGSNFRTFI